jgi:hypothetical protein
MVVFTYVIAMGAYEVLVRRISPVRMLFGMKKKRSLPPPE